MHFTWYGYMRSGIQGFLSGFVGRETAGDVITASGNTVG